MNSQKLKVPGTDLLIRPARVDEYEQVAQVTYLGFDHGPEHPVSTASREAFLLDVSGRAAQGTVWVAVDESGTLLGTATVVPGSSLLARHARDNEAELKLLAVLPQARGFGLGSQLVKHVLEAARLDGHTALLLDTADFNERAQRLYLRHGFTRDGALEIPAPGDEYSFHVYRRHLSPVGFGVGGQKASAR